MIPSNLSVFWHCSYLIKTFWFDVRKLFSTIKFVTSLLEIVFHHINVCFVVLHVNSGVFDEQNAEFMEALCHFLALFLSLGWDIVWVYVWWVDESFEVDNWDITEFITDNLFDKWSGSVFLFEDFRSDFNLCAKKWKLVQFNARQKPRLRASDSRSLRTFTFSRAKFCINLNFRALGQINSYEPYVTPSDLILYMNTAFHSNS